MNKAAILGSAALLLAGIWAPAQAQFKAALDTSEQTSRDTRASQQRIDQLDDQTASLLNDYRANLKQLEAARRYNASLERQIAAQEADIARLREDIENFGVLQRALRPLMEDMIAGFGELVAADLPFLKAERGARVDRMNGLLDAAEVTAAQQYRLIVEAYQIENEYGRTIGAYEGSIDYEGQNIVGEFLRVGRMALIFKTPDDSVLAIYDRAAGENGQGAYVALDRSYLQDVKFGMRMAKEQTAPDIFFIPVKAPTSAE